MAPRSGNNYLLSRLSSQKLQRQSKFFIVRRFSIYFLNPFPIAVDDSVGVLCSCQLDCSPLASNARSRIAQHSEIEAVSVSLHDCRLKNHTRGRSWRKKASIVVSLQTCTLVTSPVYRISRRWVAHREVRNGSASVVLQGTAQDRQLALCKSWCTPPQARTFPPHKTKNSFV